MPQDGSPLVELNPSRLRMPPATWTNAAQNTTASKTRTHVASLKYKAHSLPLSTLGAETLVDEAKACSSCHVATQSTHSRAKLGR